jgi:hypothetical protein
MRSISTLGVINTMTKKFSGLLAAVAVIGFAARVNAATVTTSVQVEAPGAAAVGDGAPDGGQVHKLFLTSDADIISINQVQVTLNGGATLFQVGAPFGSDIEPPDPAFIAIKPSLAADTWLSTPGATSFLGTGLPGDGTGTWGDLTDNGAQTNYQWGQITIPAGATGTFTGRISLAGATGPEPVPFTINLGAVIPEPGSIALAGMGLVGLLGAARRRVR